jgi:hypothetical protein
MGLMNLHDAFLNASLQRREMLRAPIVDDPAAFHFSDRGRFERAWAAFLYVLVESWRAKTMGAVRELVGSCTDVSKLETLLEEGDRIGAIERLQEVRHYMAHRDRREYWDKGRLGVLLQLDYNERLHMAFSEVLLATTSHSRPPSTEGASA